MAHFSAPKDNKACIEATSTFLAALAEKSPANAPSTINSQLLTDKPIQIQVIKQAKPEKTGMDSFYAFVSEKLKPLVDVIKAIIEIIYKVVLGK